MRRRRREAEPENHERWLVSYADFITLLFAFFVVMFANSQVDRQKVSKVSEAVKEALEENTLTATFDGWLGRKNRAEQAKLAVPPSGKLFESVAETPSDELLPSLGLLKAKFRDQIREGKMQVQMTSRGLVISMSEAAFFPSGDDRIRPETYPVIEQLSDVLKRLPNAVRMEGHTDSTPISNSRFRSNWELSAARSIAMMELATARFGVARNKVAIAGYADTVPVAPNYTAEGRSRNRRVDIILLSQLGQQREPGK